MKYYVPIRQPSPIWKHFMYMDAADEYHADSLFAKHELHVKFRKGEWLSPDGRYRFVYCQVPKKEVSRFEEAMEELPNRMLLLGYSDYVEYWEKTMKFFEENRRK